MPSALSLAPRYPLSPGTIDPWAKTAAAPLDSSHVHEPAPRDVAAFFPDAELAALARERLAASVETALTWAQAQTDSGERERFLFAVVEAWAENDPVAAARWALSREKAATERFMEAAFAGAAQNPELAVEIGQMLLAADPAVGAAHGAALVGALTGAEKFDAAFRFAGAAPAESREEWLAAAFRRWGAQKPEEAFGALSSLAKDDAARMPAFRSLAAGWAERDPAALAGFVHQLPASEEREAALARAFANWSLQDPAGLSKWLHTLPPGPEFDRGAAALLARSDGVNRSIEVGLRWVESISNADLRRESLRHILAEWQRLEPAVARNHLAAISWLTPGERNELVRTLDAELNAAPTS